MDQLKTILAAIDFSPCSADAFQQAARIAAWNGASLSALHVVEYPLLSPTDGLYPALPIAIPPFEDFVAEARNRWTAFAPGCAARKSTPLAIEMGNARQVILDQVHRDRPDLLVIGAHSVLDADRSIGATAAACAQRAGTRVLVVREGQTGPFKSVLVCVDFGDTSKAALEQAVRVAAQDGSEVSILHAFDDPWHGLPAPADISANMPDFEKQYRRACEDRLRSFSEPFAHELNALKAGFHAVRGQDHGEAIIAFAQTHGCDLVILGTRGAWNMRDFFWGSTAERVVRECACSVLAVKPAGFVQLEPQRRASAGKQAFART